MFFSRKRLFCILLSSACNLSIVRAINSESVNSPGVVVSDLGNSVKNSNENDSLNESEVVRDAAQGILINDNKMEIAVSSDVGTSDKRLTKDASSLNVAAESDGAKGILSAESEDFQVYHIGFSKKDLKGAKYAILTGDPKRVPKIASFLENSEQIGDKREYNSYLGICNGEPVVVTSTGIGGPSTAIAVEELVKLGIENFIRVGTSGGIQLNVYAGDLVIAKAAVRQEGTSKEYAPVEYPAVSDFEISGALYSSAKKIARESGKKVHMGTVQCKDSFYGQHDPDCMPVSKKLNEKWEAWKKLGVKCSEMETASLFVVSDSLSVRTGKPIRAGAVLLVVWNQEQEKQGISQDTNFNTDFAIKTAVDAISNLIRNDKDNNSVKI